LTSDHTAAYKNTTTCEKSQCHKAQHSVKALSELDDLPTTQRKKLKRKGIKKLFKKIKSSVRSEDKSKFTLIQHYTPQHQEQQTTSSPNSSIEPMTTVV